MLVSSTLCSTLFYVCMHCRDLRENYCRNPDGRDVPWCLTTDPNVPWVFCTSIPGCEAISAEADGKLHFTFSAPFVILCFNGPKSNGLMSQPTFESALP